jgi:hypothetical protein
MWYHSVIYPSQVDITEWVYFEKELFNKEVPFSNISRSFQETFHKVVILLNGSIWKKKHLTKWYHSVI